MNDEGSGVLFIAEISANHLGSLDRARNLVREAARVGATAVKFQTYTADTMTLNIKEFSVSNDHELWGGKRLYDLYKEAHTPWEWHAELFELSRELGLIPFSSPFDLSAVEFLESLNCPIYKIASLETGDHALIRAVAKTGKPLIISTGATEWDEIEDLVNVVQETGNENLTLLVCTSSYPARAADAHLRRMLEIREKLNVKVGVSDHTLGIGVSLAAVGLGAVAIEKHLTLNRSDGGADSAFSMEPDEFQTLVSEGNDAYLSLGKREWSIQDSEKESRRLRRSLYIVKDVKAGELLTTENVRAIRPGEGCSPKYLEQLLGKRFSADAKMGTPLRVEDVS
jgi:N-acetylneuraminate synthase